MTMAYATPSHVTLRRPAAPIEQPREDPALRAWEQGGHVVVPAYVLLRAAQEKMLRLLRLEEGWDGHRGRPTRPIAAVVLAGVLERLLFDGAATPQIAPLPDGGIQVMWLVAGHSLQVDVTPDGEVFVDALDDHSGEIVSGEYLYWRPDDVLLDLARAFLAKISHDIELRLAH